MDFSCLHCVGVSADGEARVMTDMLMCLTGRAQSERGGETAAADRQTARERERSRKMLMLFAIGNKTSVGAVTDAW